MTREALAVAVSNRVNKILVDTLKSLSEGPQSLQLLEEMRVKERDDWVLYYVTSPKWWPCWQRQYLENIEQVLKTLARGDKYAAEIKVLVLQDYLPDVFSEPIGAGDDPFGLRYTVKIDYA